MTTSGFDGRREDEPLLRGCGTYIDGLDVPELAGAAHAAFVRSAEAHARLASVDVTEARAADGVVAVYLGPEVDGWPFPPRLPSMNRDLWRPLMAADTVRFVGEPIAVVVAETRAAAVDAAELVVVDYEPLPPVVDLDASLAGETLVHEHAGTNVALAWELAELPSEVWDGCDVTVEFDLWHPRLGPHPIEPLSGASRWGPDGRCTAWVCSQRPAGAKHVIETLLGLEHGTVRAISPDVGGGFGAKGGWGCYPEDVVVAWAARRLDRPIRWAQTRSEASLAMGHGRASRHRVRIGGNLDGTIVAYSVDALQDSGAFPAMGTNVTTNLRNSGTGVYDIAHATLRGTSVVTNTTPTVAFRGAGRPEAACSIERAVDRFAAAIGRDPLQVRLANLVPADRFPYRTAVGATYDSGNYTDALLMAAELADYDGLRAEQTARRSAGVGDSDGDTLLGIGVSCTTEVTGGGEGERATALLLEDGTVEVVVGTSPHGQGHETTFAPVVATQLGLDAAQVVISHDDSDRSPVGGGTIGSRSAQLGGSAAHGAAVKLVAAARERAAALLEADPGDIVLDADRGRLHVIGTPARSLGWSDLAAEGELRAEHHFRPEGGAGSFSFGACVAAVEVDAATGEVALRRLLSVDDAGVILQPVLAHGQVHGGLALAVGAALYEQMRYDDHANPITVGLADYAMPSAAELPFFETHETVTPSPLNPLGVKGIGESGTVVATPAIHSAVLDALSPHGVEHLDLPLTPEKIWRALQRSAAA
ncbi:xanthine dehydrogenase family protein molybdopterin-binding subunit [Candidatus Poriferisodalis sp.]|uniref:xanthine dehydrogenase family protein molybdopterin-binding subunit n=1 Tax=Candidatus Poriferisodalis sp. TaxID=3101277 RepID=UPI003B02AC20